MKAVAEQLSRGEVSSAVERLDRQGRVHEIHPREERRSATAIKYVKDPDSPVRDRLERLHTTHEGEIWLTQHRWAEVEVRWPDRAVQRVKDVAVREVVKITEPEQ